jgi:uncharacterized protein YijF (DUF1287 family)
MKRKEKRRRVWPVASLVLLAASAGALSMLSQRVPSQWWQQSMERALPSSNARDAARDWLEPEVKRVAISDPIARKIVAAAHAQEGDLYDASYQKLSFPGGDVPKGTGACTDVVVRALRGAGYDLQKLINADMSKNFAKYPNSWGLGRTDKNIDHRRVPNHMVFFERFGRSLPLGTTGADLKTWLPGDIVCWKMEGGKWHTGVVSDGIGASGKPLVIHNAWVCTEQDYLENWPIIGHYRFPKR